MVQRVWFWFQLAPRIAHRPSYSMMRFEICRRCPPLILNNDRLPSRHGKLLSMMILWIIFRLRFWSKNPLFYKKTYCLLLVLKICSKYFEPVEVQVRRTELWETSLSANWGGFGGNSRVVIDDHSKGWDFKIFFTNEKLFFWWKLKRN